MPMTSRERLLAAMRNQPVDHLPCGPFGTARLDRSSPVCRELIEKTDIFLPVGIGGNAILGGNAEVETCEVGRELTSVIRTPKGDLTRRIASTKVTSATVEYPLKELEDIDKLLSIDYTHGRKPG